VVKANAYGCGALECSRVFSEAGAAMLAVTRVEEAIPLRENGIQTPILLLAPALKTSWKALSNSI
jgi:alanine racemase